MATIPSNKIFIDREAATGDFLMRMPAEAMPAFYEMLTEAPLAPRRWFYQVKDHLEQHYNSELVQAGLVKPKAEH